MRITTTTDEGVTFLRISGDVDIAAADELRKPASRPSVNSAARSGSTCPKSLSSTRPASAH